MHCRSQAHFIHPARARQLCAPRPAGAEQDQPASPGLRHAGLYRAPTHAARQATGEHGAAGPSPHSRGRESTFAGPDEIRVSDTGCGIPPDILAHVFEPFFTTERGRGTDLGLSISQACVRSHNGKIRVDLVRHFNRELRKNFTGFTPGAAELLQNYPWPGNVRELKNAIERTMILISEGDIDAASLPEEIRDYRRSGSNDRAGKPADADLEIPSNGRPLITLRELEDN